MHVPNAGPKGFGRELALPEMRLLGHPLSCQGFGENGGTGVLIRCTAATGIVIGAFGPDTVLRDLQKEIAAVTPVQGPGGPGAR